MLRYERIGQRQLDGTDWWSYLELQDIGSVKLGSALEIEWSSIEYHSKPSQTRVLRGRKTKDGAYIRRWEQIYWKDRRWFASWLRIVVSSKWWLL